MLQRDPEALLITEVLLFYLVGNGKHMASHYTGQRLRGIRVSLCKSSRHKVVETAIRELVIGQLVLQFVMERSFRTTSNVCDDC